MIDKKKNINEIKYSQLNLESYGVKIGIKIDKRLQPEEIFDRLDSTFPNGFEKIPAKDIEHEFFINCGQSNRYLLIHNGQVLLETPKSEQLIDHFDSQLRTTVAKYAVGKVFLHAGVVGWKGKAIIIPGKSFAGKTTLVAELVKRGAEYYSDEYAVFDENGLVHPFAKKLSMRGIIDEFHQLDVSVEDLNGKRGTEPISVGIVLLTEYEKGKKHRFNTRTTGVGLMELMPHTFTMAESPKYSLSVLNKAISCGIILKTKRSEAGLFADQFLNYLADKKIF